MPADSECKATSESSPRRGVYLLSPHIDDVAFSIGGALLDGRFAPCVILNVFSVSCCTRDDRSVSVPYVTNLRKTEDGKFFRKMIPACQIVNLDMLDAPLRLHIPEQEVFRVAESDADLSEVHTLCSVLAAISKWPGILLAPLALGKHVDHLIVHRAAGTLLRQGWAAAFYEDLPYAGGMTKTEIEQTVADVARELGQDLRPLLLPLRAAGRRKCQEIRVYESQVDESTMARISGHGRRLCEVSPAERLWCDGDSHSRICGCV